MQLRFVSIKIILRIAAMEKEIKLIKSLLFILHYIKLTLYLVSFAQKDVLKVDFYFYTLSTF